MKQLLSIFIIFIIFLATCGEPLDEENQPLPDRYVRTDIWNPAVTLRSNTYLLTGYSVSLQTNLKAIYFSLSTNNYNLITFNSNSKSANWSTNIVFPDNNSYALNAYAVDFNDNYSLTNTKFITVDTSPVITVDYPFNNQIVINTNFYIRGSVIDYDNSITNLSYTLNDSNPIQLGSGWGTASAWSHEFTLPQQHVNGTNYTLIIYAIDENNSQSSNVILFSVNTNAFIFDVAMDGNKEAIYSNAKFFDDPDNDELTTTNAFREITGIYVTNDINYLYLAIGLKDLTNTSAVDLGFMIDLDNQQDIGGTGYSFDRHIECHADNRIHLSDLQFHTDLGNTFEANKWDKTTLAWEIIAINTNDYAFSTNFFELRIKLNQLDLENEQPIFIRAFSTGPGNTSAAYDVAPVNDSEDWPEATLIGTSYVFNPSNDSGEYRIVR